MTICVVSDSHDRSELFVAHYPHVARGMASTGDFDVVVPRV